MKANPKAIKAQFFQQDAIDLAKALLGKVLVHKKGNLSLRAQIIETEAYYLHEKSSHSSKGYTEKRKAMFMPAGTIYMYYSRGGDSMNISAEGKGNAVLVKSAIVAPDITPKAFKYMQKLNLATDGSLRPAERLVGGQTLMCKALGIRVQDWDAKQFNDTLNIQDIGYKPYKIIQTTRLGIPLERDAHLPYRFIDYAHAKHCSKNPITKRDAIQGKTYEVLYA